MSNGAFVSLMKSVSGYVGTIDKNELHRRMSETLPPFMVPGYLRPIETIVLNKNGKIDRKATLALMEGT